MLPEKIFDYIEDNVHVLCLVTKQLISVPTINPPGENYEKMVGLLDEKCKSLSLKTKRFEIPKDELNKLGITTGSKRICLVADWNTGARKTLHINSHYDVVPVTGNWQTPPFCGVIKDGKIFGRGTEDMKGTIACILSAIGALKHFGIRPNLNIQLSFTPDEETGGRSGLEYFLKKGKLKADYVISEGYSGDFASSGNKGVLWLEVTVSGKSAHASEPYKGVNSFEKMLDVANVLRKLKNDISKRKTRFAMKDMAAKSPSFVMGGVLSGGSKINIVPDKSVFTIDRRILPEETTKSAKKEILKQINKLKKKDKSLKVKIKVLSFDRPVVVRCNNKLFKVFGESIKSVYGKKINFAIMSGATDARFFIKKRIPAVGYSADGNHTGHSDNEFVYIRSLVDTTKVFALTFANMRG